MSDASGGLLVVLASVAVLLVVHWHYYALLILRVLLVLPVAQHSMLPVCHWYDAERPASACASASESLLPVDHLPDICPISLWWQAIHVHFLFRHQML